MPTGLAYTNQLHFTVLEQASSLFMLLMDLSLYSENLPSTPVYDIIPPGYSAPIRISALPKGITSINSALLFSTFTGDLPTLAGLPDGVYIITYKVQPYDTFHVTHYELRTTVLENTMDTVYMAVELNCRHAWYQRWKTDLLNIFVMLSTAKALTRLGNLDSAGKVFKEVQVEVARMVRITNKLTV